MKTLKVSGLPFNIKGYYVLFPTTCRESTLNTLKTVETHTPFKVFRFPKATHGRGATLKTPKTVVKLPPATFQSFPTTGREATLKTLKWRHAIAISKFSKLALGPGQGSKLWKTLKLGVPPGWG